MTLYKMDKTTAVSKKLTQWIGALAICSLISACGSGGGAEDKPVVTPPESSAGSVQFASSAVSINEAAGSINITVTRTEGSEGDISVDYTISNDSASADDYSTQNMTGTLSWADADSQSKTISFNIIDDELVEESERLNINLSNAINEAVLGTNDSAELTIIDNDSLVVIPDTLYFYVSENNNVKSVYAYDPENLNMPMSSILVDENTQGENIVSSFDLNLSQGVVSNFKIPAIMYIKGGIIWKVLADSTASVNNPIQVSSENNALLCNGEAFVNDVPDNLNDSVYFYYDAGVDGLCYSDDDQWKYVKFGWDSSINPVVTMDFVADLADDNITGEAVFLAWDDATSGLYKCSTHCSFIINLSAKPSVFGSLLDENKEYLLTDLSIVVLDISAKTISEPIYSFSFAAILFPAFTIEDGEFSYFSNEGKIFKLDSLGNPPLELIDEGENKFISLSPFAVSNERLIYSVIDGFNSTSEIRTLLKTGGESMQLASAPNEGLLIAAKGGDRIYYNYILGATPFAGTVLIDGSAKVESQNKTWVGSTRPTTFSLFLGTPALNVYQLDNSSAVISVFDAANFTFKKDIGSLPNDISSIGIFILGIGDIARIYAMEGSAFSSDLFYSDLSSATPLARITNSPNVDEAVIIY